MIYHITSVFLTISVAQSAAEFEVKMRRDLILTTKNGELRVGEGHQTFIIAEIGQNHQGDLEIAKRMIEAAKDCGADCVKFQKTNLHQRFTESALNQPYESDNSWGSTYGTHRKHLEFSKAQFYELNDYAASNNILFAASPMDEESLEFLSQLKPPFIKIGSGDANNFPLLEKAAKLCIPLIVSTGMQKLSTLERAYEIISKHHQNFVLMHCMSSYPTKYEDVNLNLIYEYRNRFPDIHIGYSGHEEGNVTHLAVAAGAKVIERHFTLDKTWKGSDHKCSLDRDEFAKMVQEIRQVEVIMGGRERVVYPCELACRRKLGKSLVAARKLTAGEIVNKEDIAVKVAFPMGASAEYFQDFVGLKLVRDLNKDECLSTSHFGFHKMHL